MPVLLVLIAAIALLALVLASLPAQAASDDADAARVIVKFKALGPLMREARQRGDRGPQQAATLAGRHGMSLRDGRMIDARSQVVWGDRTLTSAALAARLAQDADVEYAVPDERRHALALPNDPLLPAASGSALAAGQWYLQPADATLVSAINAVGAWAITTGSASLVVADVDTGVLLTHPDLAAKLVPGYDFVSSTTTSGDGGGRDGDATDPGDWTTAGQCGSGVAATNSSWHGTETSSLIGAQTNNGVGMASVGYNVKVLPVRVLGKCGGSDSDIIAGMLWAAGLTSVPTSNANPAKVINLSLGGSGSCSAAYQDAINQLVAAGVTVIAAAGNEEGLAVGVPANCSGVIAVAGVRHAGTKVGFSSIGPQVAIAAPGGNCVNSTGACLYPILTATNAGTTTAGTHTYSNSSNYSVGTSFAAPMVAGAAALMLSANPSLKPAQVKSLLQSTARSFPAQPAGSSVPVCRAPTAVAQDECHCTTSTCGAGLLDVGAAVAAAANTATPTAGITASATTVVAGTTVALDGSASTAPGTRTITGWQWAITSGAALASFSGASNAATASLKTIGIGAVTVQLTVTDSLGQQATSTQAITVTAPAAPTVGIVASASAVAAGTPVSFDGGSASAATGFSIVSYQWTVSASPAHLASFTSATNAATAAVATLGSGSGTFVVTLTVTDSLGQTGSANTTVTVTALGPTASISPSATGVTAGNSVTLDSAGSSAPAGRTLTGYQWSLTSGSGIAAFSGNTTGATATVATSAAGTFTVQLTLTDSAGAQAVQTQTVTVAAAAAATTSGAGGGGGAVSALWLLALLAAAGVARRTVPVRTQMP
ncbi:S8 family serine peptidase [Roseateles sp. LYH14W]|uniref:S8 family serine peptidase n=1 Tax=Pelomonas parva TaxID=3299032 RepID=A0ABW7FAY6_9BURK